MKIGIAFSGGGHYQEAMNACRDIITNGQYEIFFVTYKQSGKRPNNGRKFHYVAHPMHGFILRRIFLFLVNFFQSFSVYMTEKPDVIISTGADVTLSIMLISKLFGKKIVFIESGANVTQPSLTGRLIYPYCDLFIIQWEELKLKYSRAVYGGPLL
jgi:beta-1,4-N-acetylglucosaminyltransferase